MIFTIPSRRAQDDCRNRQVRTRMLGGVEAGAGLLGQSPAIRLGDLSLFMKLPFAMRHRDVCNVLWIKWWFRKFVNQTERLDLSNNATAHDCHILNLSSVVEHEINDLIIHSCFGLRMKKLAPFFRQYDSVFLHFLLSPNIIIIRTSFGYTRRRVYIDLERLFLST